MSQAALRTGVTGRSRRPQELSRLAAGDEGCGGWARSSRTNVRHLFTCSCLSAQKVSGRHFHRDTLLPKTPAATNVVEAGHTTRKVKPLQKLRSGRAWPKHHFRRLPAAKPIAPAKTTVKPVNATAAKKTTKRSGFWGRRK